MRIFVFPPFFFLVAYICVRKAGNLDHPHTLLSRETIVIKLDVSFQKKKKKMAIFVVPSFVGCFVFAPTTYACSPVCNAELQAHAASVCGLCACVEQHDVKLQRTIMRGNPLFFVFFSFPFSRTCCLFFFFFNAPAKLVLA